MDPLRPDAGDAALAAACTANAGAIGQIVAGYQGAVAEQLPWIHRHRGSMRSGLWNAVTWAAIDPDGIDDAVADTLAWYEGSCRWWVGPDSAPAHLGERLVAAGFDHEELPGMAADLDADWDRPDPDGLEVSRCTRVEDLSEAMEVFEACYEDRGWTDAWRDVFAWVGFADDAAIQVFVGRVDGRAVSASWLARGAGVTGIYGVHTVPSERGRGLGAALTRAPMRAGRDAGDHVAVLQAAPLAAPLYARIGFREVCRIGLYER